MNISNFQILLHEAIDNATSTIDWLFLARAIEKLDMGQIRTVSTYANLPSAASNEGLLVFVDADERLYWSTGTAWYSIVQENKGFAYAWGDGTDGILGNNCTTCRSSPVSVVGGFTDWCQVSVTYRHSLGLRSNGTVWSWGCDTLGQLGDNCNIARSSPVSVVGGFTDWCQVSSGNFHSLGVRSNGTAWAWGFNYAGLLGDNSTINRSSPVSVVGGFTDWCQVSAKNHSLGLRRDGTAWAWGSGTLGRLGDDSTINRSSPVSVVGGFTNWSQVSAGNDHSLGLRSNGTAWAWGSPGLLGSALGDGTTIERSSPVSVVGGFTDWCQLSAGSDISLGIRTNGTAWAWGYAEYGRLGTGNTINRDSPVSVAGGFTDWCQVSAGRRRSLALRGTNFC